MYISILHKFKSLPKKSMELLKLHQSAPTLILTLLLCKGHCVYNGKASQITNQDLFQYYILSDTIIRCLMLAKERYQKGRFPVGIVNELLVGAFLVTISFGGNSTQENKTIFQSGKY